MNTDHIRLCRARFHMHLIECDGCFKSYYGSKPGMCETGKVLWGEYCAAITANRDCEHLTAKEAI